MSSLSIKIPNVSESLEDKLEALILGGAFWPDRPLASERRLSEELGVSRTTLRNALASLKDKELLTQDGKRFYPTNLLASRLVPGLEKIGADQPDHLVDYWLMFFAEALLLAKKKSRNSDRVEIQKAARQLKQCLAGEDANGAAAAFDALCRSVLDSCYNYFLSQTDFALRGVLQAQIVVGFESISASDDATAEMIKAVGALANFDFEPQSFRLLFGKAASATEAGELAQPLETDQTPEKLIDVVLRHPLFFEAIYELRLITEKHAAISAACNATGSQVAALQKHLDEMTIVADTSPADYSRLDTTFHQIIATCAQNPVFVLIDHALAPVFSRTTNQWLKKHMEMRSDQSVIHLQHSQIVDAIVRQDAKASQDEMVEHLAYVLRNLRHMRERDRLQEIATARHLLK